MDTDAVGDAGAVVIRLHFHSHSSRVRLSRRGCRETIIARLCSPCFVCVTVEHAGIVYDWFDDDLLMHRAEDHEAFRPGPRRTIAVHRAAFTRPCWDHLPYRILWRNCAHFAAACIGLPWLPCLTPDALWLILAPEVHRAARTQPASESRTLRPIDGVVSPASPAKVPLSSL